MFIWFSKDVSLTELLEKWRRTGSNYQPNQPVDSKWYVDGQTAALGRAENDALFQKAVDRLFAFDIFPTQVMRFAADFMLEKRPPAFGDRVIQRITVVPFILDVAVMSIVTSVWHETDRRGYTMVTSEHHYGMGEWTASVTRKRGGQISFLMHSIYRPGGRLPRFATVFARAVQLRAHRQAFAHFKEVVRL